MALWDQIDWDNLTAPVYDSLVYSLRCDTLRYWEEHKKVDCQSRWKDYVFGNIAFQDEIGILPRELLLARHDPNRFERRDARGNRLSEKSSRIPGSKERRSCRLLIQLVGHSLEPLLISVSAWRPDHLLLVLNKNYGDKVKCEDRLSTLMEYCYPQLFGDSGDDSVSMELFFGCDPKEARPGLISYVELEGDAPEDEFRALLSVDCKVAETQKSRNVKVRDLIKSAALEDGPGVMIDITGGKKTMVAGAFLFAALRHIPVTYVDFDDAAYEIEWGKPYGYASVIQRVQDPIKDFRLLGWRRLRELYENCSFRAAKSELKWLAEPLAGLLKGPQFEGLDANTALDRLGKLLKIYHAWDNGQYPEARDALHGVNESDEATKQWLAKLRPAFLGPSDATSSPIEQLGEPEPGWGRWPESGAKSGTSRARQEIVKHLNGLATKLDEGDSESACEVYKKPFHLDVRFAVYLEDEYEKIKRLIDTNEDFRSAMLRSVALVEMLVRARYMILFEKNLVEVAMRLGTDSPDARLAFSQPSAVNVPVQGGKSIRLNEWIPSRIARYESVPKLHEDLIGWFLNNSSKERKLQVSQCVKLFLRNPSVPRRLTESVHDGVRWYDNELQRLRNKSIHSSLSVPEEVATYARDLGRDSIDEFKGWYELCHGTQYPVVATERMLWPNLLNCCELEFMAAFAQHDSEFAKPKE